jgi:exopolyphosphatase/guanosine-5'-triphosphate,3'-diphosphate pyrophosphatase
MRSAAIDIGTNSIRLLISDYDGSEFCILERRMEITRIGKNLGISKNILKKSADATSKVLQKYNRLMQEYGVERYRAVGTSALRKAANSGWFISYIKDNTGIDVEKITGEEEARLSFQGASAAIKPGTQILVIDIGGGSTEFILGNIDMELDFNESIDIGSVSLSERFIKSDKPTHSELKDMQGYVKDRIRPVINKIRVKDGLTLVGVAGTITTIAAIDLKLETYDSEVIHQHILKGRRVNNIYHLLCSLTLKERRRVPGLQPERADIIIGGTAVLVEIMDLLEIKSLIVSEQDILDGIIYSLTKF